MAGIFLAGPRLSVQRLYPHVLDQGADMLAAHTKARPIELLTQHACTHERVFQMQFINAAHQDQICSSLTG